VHAGMHAGAHERGDLPDAPLGSGLIARWRGSATRLGANVITGSVTAAVSLATHTRWDDVVRLGRTTTPWVGGRKGPTSTSHGEYAYAGALGVRRRHDRCVQTRCERGEKQHGARALAKAAAPARNFPARHEDRPHTSASTEARERSG
jgi:hypothetical protein